MARISVRGLAKRFGKVWAITDLGFDVPSGRVAGFLGPNGAGKTTTLRLMLGLVRPTAGEALINGVPYRQLRSPRRVVGAVLESSGFHPARTGRNHLLIIAASADIPPTRVDHVIDDTGLADIADRRVGSYSLGQCQRLGLAAALIGDPEILIFDEPANGLDPEGIAWLRRRLRGWAADGRTVILSSHLLSEAAQTIDHAVIISKGRLGYAGPLDALASRGQSLEEAFLRLTRADSDSRPEMTPAMVAGAQ